MANLANHATVGGYPLVGTTQPGGSLTLVPLSIPAAPAVAVVSPPSTAASLTTVADSSSTLAATTYYLDYAWGNSAGTTTVSPEASIAIGTANADAIQFSVTLPADTVETLVGMGTSSGGESQYFTVNTGGTVTYVGTNSAGASATVSGSTLTITVSAPPTDTSITMPTTNTANINGTGSAAGSDLAANTTYYYAATAIAADGTETSMGPTVAWTEGSTAYPITLNLQTVAEAEQLNVYKGTSATSLNFLAAASGLQYTDSGDTATTSQVPPTANQTGSAQFGGLTTRVGGQSTYGMYGMPAVVAGSTNLPLTSTSATQIFSFTPPGDGLYTAKVYLRVTATTTATVTIAYDDSGGSQTYTPSALNDQSLSAGSYSMVDYSFEATSSAAVTLTVTASVANQVYVTSALVGVS